MILVVLTKTTHQVKTTRCPLIHVHTQTHVLFGTENTKIEITKTGNTKIEITKTENTKMEITKTENTKAENTKRENSIVKRLMCLPLLPEAGFQLKLV